MAYNDVLVFTAFVALLVTGAFFLGYTLGKKAVTDSVEFTLKHSKLTLTPTEAEEKPLEQQTGFIPAETLMAFGVTRAKDLPKEVKESLGVKDDDDYQIDGLYEEVI